MPGPAAAAMVEDLRRWSAELTRADVTTAEVATAIGAADGDATAPQVDVRPDHDQGWAAATVIDGPAGDGPSHVTLTLAEGAPLAPEDLDEAFGPPGPSPARIHFDAPEQRIYVVDTGQRDFTAAVIAEIAAGARSPVRSVTLRRDPRLE